MKTICANLTCLNEIEQVEGQKPKKYCDNICRQKDYRKKVSEERKLFKNTVKGEFIDSQPKNTFQFESETPQNASKTKNTPSANKKENKATSEAKNEFTECEILPNEDNNAEKIKEYEDELLNLGKSSLANTRRKWLNNKISELKNQ